MVAVAVLLPWLALMIRRRPIQGIFCLILQITVLGWIPAAVWAVIVVMQDNQDRRHREMLEAVRGRQ